MADIAVHGAAGRMGSRVVALAAEEGNHRVVAAIDRPGHPRLGQDAGAIAGGAPLGVPLAGELAQGLRVAAAIDFSESQASQRFVAVCVERRIPVIVATTGQTDEGRAAVERAAQVIPILLAPNLSFGVALVRSLVETAARALGLDADVEIVESHHRKKKDAPSGTALELARAIAAARGQELATDGVYGRRGVSEGDRRRGEIAIHALRLGDVVGEHTVTFGFGPERIEISHKAHSRDVFARGALRAVSFIASAAPGLYGPADLLQEPRPSALT